MHERREPRPELDARFSDPDAVATPWSAVTDVLQASELFWITTVRVDGRPHVTPLPAVWHDDALHFCTGPGEQKARNLERSARCALTTGTSTWKAGLDIVVEGDASRVTADDVLHHLAARWRTKYHGDWNFEVRDGVFHHEGGEALVFAVRPAKVLAFAKGRFAQTRFRFS